MTGLGTWNPACCLLLVEAALGAPGAVSAAPTPAIAVDRPPMPVCVRRTGRYTSWRWVTVENGLPSNTIEALRRVDDHRIWIATDRGLARYADGVIKTWTPGKGLPARIITAVDVDPVTQDLWLGTWGRGVLRMTGGRFDRFGQLNSGLSGNLVFHLVFVRGTLWVATNGGVNAYDPFSGSWRSYQLRRTDHGGRAVTGFAFDGNTLYAGMWREGVLRFDAPRDRWIPVALGVEPEPAEGSPAAEGIAAIAVAQGSGTFWWATQNKVAHLGSSNRPAPTPIPLPIDPGRFVTCLAARTVTDPPASPQAPRHDSNGPTSGAAVSEEVWVGTEQGLWVLSPGRAPTGTSLPGQDGPVGSQALQRESVEPRRSGSPRHRWANVSGEARSGGSPPLEVGDTMITSQHDAHAPIASPTSEDVGHLTGSRSAPPSLASSHIRCLVFGRDEVWIGTDQGLLHGWNHNPQGKPHEPAVRTKPSRNREGAAPIPNRDRQGAPAIPNRDRQGAPAIPYRNRQGAPAVASARSVMAIAVLGPRNRSIAVPGDHSGFRWSRPRADALAVQLAVQQANERYGEGGGNPFELVTRGQGYETYGWGAPEDEFVTYLRQDRITGVVGALAPDDHVGDLVVLRSEMPVLNAVPRRGLPVRDGRGMDSRSGNVSENRLSPTLRFAKNGAPAARCEPRNPWTFRCWGDQPRSARRFLDFLFDRLGCTRVVALRTPGACAKRHLDWWSDHAAQRGCKLAAEIPCDLSESQVTAAVHTLRRLEPDAVLSWCDIGTSAMLLRRLREGNINALFVGGYDIVSDDFAHRCGMTPGKVLALVRPQRCVRTAAVRGRPSSRTATASAERDPSERVKATPVSAFVEAYTQRNVIGGAPTPPGWDAYASFDAADHLLEALRTAGRHGETPGPPVTRRQLREALEAMLRSATGERHYERRCPPGEIHVARLEHGQWSIQTLPPNP